MTSLEAIQKENAALRKIIAMHDDQLERCKGVLYQLIGGLFHQKSQRLIMNMHINTLLNPEEDEENKHEEDKDEEDEDQKEKFVSVWPTTRQGDEHEARISKLEEIIKNLEKKVEIMENKQ